MTDVIVHDLMMYMCSEELSLKGQQLACLGNLIESESQRAFEEAAEPISDDKEIEESENVEGNIEFEKPY